ncbi:restriction endonuclease subunit S [Bacteroides sp. 90-K9/2]|uniref:methylation-associated defense system restriction endonuclease subunit S MAD5 n=1 Tax=Bacteroides sp. 90-K9/2 TaxID=3142453 RepID=UPI0039B6D69E
MKCRVINSQEVLLSKRFDGSYHNAEVNIYSSVIERHSSFKLKDYCTEIFTSGRNKRVYTTKEFGYPFLSNSDVVAADPLASCKYSSKKYGFDEKAILRKGMILTGRVGAIGQTAFVPGYLEAYNAMGSDNIIRICVKPEERNGFIYAYLASKIGNLSFWKHATGGVQPFITDAMVGELPIPDFPEAFQKEVDDLIQESARLREEATEALEDASKLLKHYASLSDLTEADYDYYGPRSYERQVSCFVKSRKDIDSTTINAFNHSERIKNTKDKITCLTRPLKDLIINGDVFSTGSFPRIEVKEDKGIMLINQSDIFDTIIRGKHISKRNVKLSNLVEYGEVLIAGVGTLGENETFCRCIYANEDLVNQLVSGEFIRMKTIEEIPSGYLYTWLSSDYGFRFIRNLQTGTKLCRPIPRLLLEIPVPIIESNKMKEIHDIVTDAYTKRYKANCLVKQAIGMIENEIEHWNK